MLITSGTQKLESFLLQPMIAFLFLMVFCLRIRDKHLLKVLCKRYNAIIITLLQICQKWIWQLQSFYFNTDNAIQEIALAAMATCVTWRQSSEQHFGGIRRVSVRRMFSRRLVVIWIWWPRKCSDLGASRNTLCRRFAPLCDSAICEPA